MGNSKDAEVVVEATEDAVTAIKDAETTRETSVVIVVVVELIKTGGRSLERTNVPSVRK